MTVPPQVLRACSRFALDPEGVEPIGSFDNALYRVERDGVEAILRLSGPSGRPPDQIRAEVAWIGHLAAGGVPCAQALASPQGRLVEVIDHPAGGVVSAVLFERVPGRHSDDADITAEFVRAWGATLGRIHALGRSYRPADPRWVRPDWHEDARAMEPLFPASEGAALARYREVVRRLGALPRPAEAFGLIHGDAHRGNFFVHLGRPILFDFYDCLRSWFVGDLAIALFYAVMDAPEPARRDAWAGWFLRELLTGYRSEHELDPRWLFVIPDLLKLRELDTYALTLHHLEQGHPEDPWAARYLVDRKQRIEADVPYLQLPWQMFLNGMD